MSQNITVSCRRSGEEAADVRARSAGSAIFLLVMLAPHSGQNLAPGGLACPQAEHARGTGAPHSAQNLAASGTAALQLGHSMPAPVDGGPTKLS
jgi:hypothetical protein